MYTPSKGSNAELFKRLVEDSNILYKKDWSTLNIDDFVFVCWAKRGYQGEKHTDYMAEIWLWGTTTLRDLCRTKVMGWENMAIMANEDDDVQDAFVDWYKNQLPDEREYLAKHGIKTVKKYAMNRYFICNSIGIHIN